MNTRRWLSVFGLCFTLLVGGCSSPTPTPTPAAPEPTATPELSPEVVALAKAQRWLEAYLGRPLLDLDVAYGAEEWPDAGLGCPEPGMTYAQVVTPGFRFDVTVDGVLYEVHTNLDASQVVLCPSAATGELPGRPEEMALETGRLLLGEALGVDAPSLPAPLTMERATWQDAALGCTPHEQTVAAGEIAGFRFQFLVSKQLHDVRVSGDASVALLCTEYGPVSPGQAGSFGGESPQVPTEVQAPLAAAQAQLAGTLGLAPDQMELSRVRWQRATFTSGALNCPAPDGVYSQALVGGYAFSLAYGEMLYELHTDRVGGTVVSCPDRASETQSDAAFELFESQPLGFAILYPVGWWAAAREDAGEVAFRPGNDLPTLGMTIERPNGELSATDHCLAAFEEELSAGDRTASAAGALQIVSGSASSGRYRHQQNGRYVVERVTCYAASLQIRQWAPAEEWDNWEEPFLRILDSLTVEPPP